MRPTTRTGGPRKETHIQYISWGLSVDATRDNNWLSMVFKYAFLEIWPRRSSTSGNTEDMTKNVLYVSSLGEIDRTWHRQTNKQIKKSNTSVGSGNRFRAIQMSRSIFTPLKHPFDNTLQITAAYTHSSHAIYLHCKHTIFPSQIAGKTLRTHSCV